MTLGQMQVLTAVRLRAFATHAFERKCVLRSVKVALVVGTVLALINHYDKLLAGSLSITDLLKIMVTYAVPYSVATFGSASQAMQMETESDDMTTGQGNG